MWWPDDQMVVYQTTVKHAANVVIDISELI